MHMPETDPHFECHICSQSFSRADHRKRHEQTHANGQPFECLYCEKTFSRRDAAKRHQKSHEQTARARSASVSQLILNKSCVACSRSRIRCSGSQPCGHCVSKELQCTFLPRKRRRSVISHAVHPERLPVGSSSPAFNDPNTFVPSEAPAVSARPFITPESETPAYGLVDTSPDDDAGRVQDNSSPHYVYDAPIYPRPPDMGADSRFISTHTGVTSTQRMDFQNSRDVNWLPFDETISTKDAAGPAFAGVDSSMAVQPTSLDSRSSLSGLEGGADHPSQSHGLLETSRSPLLHSRMSALVMSMTVGLPGMSQVPKDGMLPIDEASPDRPVTRYADGAGGRTSQADRTILKRHQSHSAQGDSAFRDSGPSWLFTLQAELRQSQSLVHPGISIPESILDESLSRMLPQLRKDPVACQHMGKDGLIFQKDTMMLFIRTYFENFHNTYPFLDQSLLCIPVWGWALCVATAAIGAKFLYIPEVTAFSDCLCGVLHEVLTQEFNLGNVEDSLPYIQARTLVAIGLCHSHKYSTMNSGYNAASLLFNSCLRFRLLNEDDRIGEFQDGQDVEQVWIAWRFRESRRRTGLFIWLLDCILAVATQTPPRFPTKLFNLRLPSTDELWQAETFQEWAHIQARRSGSTVDPQGLASEDSLRLTVREAAQRLSTTLAFPGPSTSLGMSVLVHIVIRRVWDAAWFDDNPARQPVSRGRSASGKPHSLSHESYSRYPATVPEYTRWRNNTCDSLDVIHWDALGRSARAGGHEDTLFLHLHLSRLILLTPVRELFGYINTFKRPTFSSNYALLPSDLYGNHPPDQHCRQTILTWATKDRHKARLAVIHAASIYWHVRRFSSDSFVQPLAVFMAAVALWAFGKMSKLPQSPSQPPQTTGDEISEGTQYLSHETLAGRFNDAIQGATETQSEGRPSPLTNRVDGVGKVDPPTAAQQSPASSSSCPITETTTRRVPYRRRMPSHIQIDRPIDDELVQHFIRSGEAMTVVLEGVSDLCSESGAVQALREGATILDSLGDIWTVAENYKRSLEAVFRE